MRQSWYSGGRHLWSTGVATPVHRTSTQWGLGHTAGSNGSLFEPTPTREDGRSSCAHERSTEALNGWNPVLKEGRPGRHSNPRLAGELVEKLERSLSLVDAVGEEVGRSWGGPLPPVPSAVCAADAWHYLVGEI